MKPVASIVIGCGEKLWRGESIRGGTCLDHRFFPLANGEHRRLRHAFAVDVMPDLADSMIRELSRSDS